MNQNNFVLGTANLGKAYGINNSEKYELGIAQDIFNHALQRGIYNFDTAAEYGIAEELIGNSVESQIDFKVITKIPSRESYTFEYVSNCLDSSLAKLKQAKVFGLMFHDPDVYKKKEIVEISHKLLDSGKLEHLGFSAYKLDAVLTAKELNPRWTIFQVPENILDRRLYQSKELSDLARSNNKIFTRSVFLQGLLLMDSNDVQYRFKEHKVKFEKLHSIANQLGITALDLCLSYNTSIPWSSGSVIAAASINQLDEILNFQKVGFEFNQLESLPEQILDPRQWSKN